MKIELDFNSECKKRSSECSDLERQAESCSKFVPGSFLNDSDVKTYLPLVEFIFPNKDEDLVVVRKFYKKREAEAEKVVAALDKLIEKLEKSKKDVRLQRYFERKGQKYIGEEKSDDELQTELEAESNARWDKLSDTSNLKNIYTIDINDPDSFMRVASYANAFKHAFNKLCSDENDRCSDCSIKYYQELASYQKALRDKFCVLVGYWSAKYRDITEHHESRTSHSTETKRRNRETAKRIVIDEYRKFVKNFANKSDLQLMSERKILFRIKAAVDPALKSKDIYRNGISTNTIRQILREAQEKGKINSYPKQGI
jgi:hypothetical protein